LPPVLILHISRTVFNDYGLMDKDDRPISFPVSGLQLGQFLSPPAPGQNMVYDLYASESVALVFDRSKRLSVVNHVGSASAGHYTSLVQSQNQWIELNDKVVSQSTPKDVSKQ
jgi:ubiquitin C-terminal hydrolase